MLKACIIENYVLILHSDNNNNIIIRIMAKTKLEQGFYPIPMKTIRQGIKSAEGWDYSNKEICDYVAEIVYNDLYDTHSELIQDEIALFQEIKSEVKDILDGSQKRTINIELQTK